MSDAEKKITTEPVRLQASSSDGTHTLVGVVYLPVGAPKGFFQVVHGMTEHIARYDAFMRQMAEAGYICFGHDHLGHGRTVTSPEELGFIAHKDGWLRLSEDVERFYVAVKTAYAPGEGTLPRILMGHSMGSFIVRVATARYSRPDALIVMGTGGPNPAAGMGLVVARMIKAACGEKHISKLLYTLAFGSYNSRFKQEKDAEAWLTKDISVREVYRADAFCTFKFTSSAMTDLIRLNKEANTAACLDAVGKTCPILLVSGREDPVGDHGRGVEKVYDELKARGADVRMVLYDDCRHEILNDSCREEVVCEILAFADAKGV